jgi:hypothetical protein
MDMVFLDHEIYQIDFSISSRPHARVHPSPSRLSIGGNSKAVRGIVFQRTAAGAIVNDFGGVGEIGVEFGRKEVIILRRREGWSREDRFRCGGARFALQNSPVPACRCVD